MDIALYGTKQNIFIVRSIVKLLFYAETEKIKQNEKVQVHVLYIYFQIPTLSII